jgi:hypothetical protein
MAKLLIVSLLFGLAYLVLVSPDADVYIKVLLLVAAVAGMVILASED